MLELIIIVLVVIGLVGMFKQLTKEERGIVAKAVANGTKVTAVYTAKVAKGAATMAYDTGAVVGSTVSIEGQEGLKDLKDYSLDITKNGGAAKVAIKAVQRHGEATGLTDMANGISTKKKELESELAKLRQATAELDSLSVEDVGN